MCAERRRVGSGAPWEDVVGYSRAVRLGPAIEVSGTVAVDAAGDVVGAGDANAQTRRALEIAMDAVESLGGSVEDVVRTRMYVTDISQWDEIGRAHGEIFRDVRPATTMVEVRALVDPRFLVEVEVSAIVSEDQE